MKDTQDSYLFSHEKFIGTLPPPPFTDWGSDGGSGSVTESNENNYRSEKTWALSR